MLDLRDITGAGGVLPEAKFRLHDEDVHVLQEDVKEAEEPKLKQEEVKGGKDDDEDIQGNMLD